MKIGDSGSEVAAVPVVSFDHVWVRRGGRVILEDITFALERGQFLGLVGPNGAGKTTLLHALLGLVPFSHGRVEVLGRPAGRLGRRAQAIGYVPQRSDIPPNFPATVTDVVLLSHLRGRSPWRRLGRRDREEARRALDLVGLGRLGERPVGQLSGGEQRRVLLAQALWGGTELLVLDEPTIGLDLPAEHEFYALLQRLQEELRLSVVAVSHDLVALAARANQLLCINRRMHIHGQPEQVVQSHALQEAYSCEFDFLAGEIGPHDV